MKAVLSTQKRLVTPRTVNIWQNFFRYRIQYFFCIGHFCRVTSPKLNFTPSLSGHFLRYCPLFIPLGALIWVKTAWNRLAKRQKGQWTFICLFKSIIEGKLSAWYTFLHKQFQIQSQINHMENDMDKLFFVTSLWRGKWLIGSGRDDVKTTDMDKMVKRIIYLFL